jgi:type IV pilus assembly protein PilA
MRRLGRLRRGFTLIELMIVVAIIGILSVLAIYGVTRYLKTAKTAEATNNVGAIAKNANESLTRDLMAGTWVAPGNTTGISHCVCGSALASVPAGIISVKAKKYTSDPLFGGPDWGAGTTTTGWQCLKFTIDQPQYYMYSYSESAGTCGGGNIAGDVIHAIANGDLDGNGTQSTFDMQGQVAAGESDITWAPKALETLPEE